MQPVNTHNVLADSKVHGRWSETNREYFANPRVIAQFFDMFMQAKPILPNKIDIIDLGGADGAVGEYFTYQLQKAFLTRLTLLDVVQDHLNANQNPQTKKIHQSLLDFDQKEQYNLGIMRSVLHYFDRVDQPTILQNAMNGIKPAGYLLLKAFIQHPEALGLFKDLNAAVGKSLQLVNQSELEAMLQSARGSVQSIGDAPTWYCSSENLKARYELSDHDIANQRQMILDAPSSARKHFVVNDNGFKVPIPYKVYLLRKE